MHKNDNNNNNSNNDNNSGGDNHVPGANCRKAGPFSTSTIGPAVGMSIDSRNALICFWFMMTLSSSAWKPDMRKFVVWCVCMRVIPMFVFFIECQSFTYANIDDRPFDQIYLTPARCRLLISHLISVHPVVSRSSVRDSGHVCLCVVVCLWPFWR